MTRGSVSSRKSKATAQCEHLNRALKAAYFPCMLDVQRWLAVLARRISSGGEREFLQTFPNPNSARGSEERHGGL